MGLLFFYMLNGKILAKVQIKKCSQTPGNKKNNNDLF